MIFRAITRPVAYSFVGDRMIEFEGILDGEAIAASIKVRINTVAVTVHEFSAAADFLLNVGKLDSSNWANETAVALHYSFERKTAHLVIGLQEHDWLKLESLTPIIFTNEQPDIFFSCIGPVLGEAPSDTIETPSRDEFEAGTWVAMKPKAHITLKVKSK